MSTNAKPTTENAYVRACIVCVCAYGIYVCKAARVDVFVEFGYGLIRVACLVSVVWLSIFMA